jgi:hypothetical protein
MSPLDVEYKVSLHESKHGGRWNINKDNGTITFNLPLLYDYSKRVVEQYRTKNETDAFTNDMTINFFITQLIETEVVERVCIERAHQKIKIKGGRCKPFCKVESVAMHMCYPDEWDAVKKWISDEKAKLS